MYIDLIHSRGFSTSVHIHFFSCGNHKVYHVHSIGGTFDDYSENGQKLQHHLVAPDKDQVGEWFISSNMLGCLIHVPSL